MMVLSRGPKCSGSFESPAVAYRPPEWRMIDVRSACEVARPSGSQVGAMPSYVFLTSVSAVAILLLVTLLIFIAPARLFFLFHFFLPSLTPFAFSSSSALPIPLLRPFLRMLLFLAFSLRPRPQADQQGFSCRLRHLDLAGVPFALVRRVPPRHQARERGSDDGRGGGRAGERRQVRKVHQKRMGGAEGAVKRAERSIAGSTGKAA
eukprot:5068332-Pleurochrysis_carterae.AAC.1